MRLACLFLLLTLAASCVAPSPTAPGTPVRNTPDANALYQQVPIGLCEDYPEESTSFAHVRDDMEKLQALGVNVLRVSLPWDSIEPEDDRFDFHFWDHFMEDAAAHGVSDDVAIELGMKEKATEFVAAGAQLYHAPADGAAPDAERE